MSNTHNGLIKRTKSYFFYGFVVSFVRLCWRRVKYARRKKKERKKNEQRYRYVWKIYIVWVSLREWLPFVGFVSFLVFKTNGNWLLEKDTTTITYRMLSKERLKIYKFEYPNTYKKIYIWKRISKYFILFLFPNMKKKG